MRDLQMLPTPILRTALIGLSLALVVVSGACGGAGARAASEGEDRVLEPGVEDLWAVGGIEGRDWQTFSDRIQVAFDASGRVRIFDALGGRVHLVGADGSYVRSWGEKGEGPGELAIPMDFVVHQDGSSAVLDFGKRGFVQFDAEGEYVADLPMDFSRGVPMGGLLPHPDGGAIAAGSGMFMRMGGGPTDADVTLPVRRFAFDGSGTAVLHEAWSPPRPGSESGAGFSGGDHMQAYETVTLIAFQPELHVGVFPDGRMLVADSTTWSLDVLNPDGSPAGEYVLAHSPIPVTERIQELERDRRLRELEEGGAAGAEAAVMTSLHGGGPTLQVDGPSEAQLAQIESMLFAEELPVIEQLAVDWEGRIWVERRSEDLSGNGPIDILSSEGVYLATIPAGGIRIPSAFGPNGLAAYIEMDDFDVPTVRIVRLGQLPR